MCGITGIFDTRAGQAVSPAVLERMNDSQHHRGPDEGSLHIEPGLGFGHRRLSIIDIATGQQPFAGMIADEARGSGHQNFSHALIAIQEERSGATCPLPTIERGGAPRGTVAKAGPPP